MKDVHRLGEWFHLSGEEVISYVGHEAVPTATTPAPPWAEVLAYTTAGVEVESGVLAAWGAVCGQQLDASLVGTAMCEGVLTVGQWTLYLQTLQWTSLDGRLRGVVTRWQGRDWVRQ